MGDIREIYAHRQLPDPFYIISPLQFPYISPASPLHLARRELPDELARARVTPAELLPAARAREQRLEMRGRYGGDVGRYGGDLGRAARVGAMWGDVGRCGGDVGRHGEVWGQTQVAMGEIWGRCREIWGRYAGDVGELWRR